MPKKGLQRLEQIRKPDGFDDTKDQTFMDGVETGAADFEELVQALFTQFKRVLYGSNPGNWFDEPVNNLSELVELNIDGKTITLDGDDKIAAFRRSILTTWGGLVYEDDPIEGTRFILTGDD